MKYRCTHCDHNFELAERDFHRCPNCFWTTSLVLLEEESGLAPSPKDSEALHSASPKSNFVNAKLIIVLLICAAVGTLIGILVALKPSLPKFTLPSKTPAPKFMEEKTNDVSKKQSGISAVTFLSDEEKMRLTKPFQLIVPRQLTEDEEEILKKQVLPPQSIFKKSKLSAWSEDDFEKMLEQEQKKRKVYLGWAYERAVKKVFEKYYPSAVEAYEKGENASARDLFLKSLTFPIYRNNPVRHRAVALVILRPLVNDVIGKIAVLNQQLVTQKLTDEINSINQSYQELFSVLDLQEWEQALQLIFDLKRRIDAFENQPAREPANDSAVFGLLDPEIRTAIQMEAQPKPEAVANFKAVLVDLNLKEQVVRQNTADELLKVQKQYEEISRLLKTENLEAARSKLREIQFPPELAEDARTKTALIDQAYALKRAKEEKKKS